MIKKTSKNTELGQAGDRFVTRNQLSEQFGITYSRSHLLRLEKQGKFPQRKYLSPQRCVWLLSQIQDYMNEVVKQSELN